MSRFSLKFFFLIATVLSSWSLNAQPGDPGEDPDVPITGLEWLLLGGGLWGAKKVYDLRKKGK